MNVSIHIHGACVVCLEYLTEEAEILLVKEDGHYASFAPDGTLTWADVAFRWVHRQHTN